MKPEETQVPEALAAGPRSRLLAWTLWIMPALLAVVVILPLRSAVADWNDVPSGSMWPTILEGDRIFVDTLAYGLRIPFTTVWLRDWEAPKRGDIITFASPNDGIRLVKRVIGIPGDRIAMFAGTVQRNGVLLDEDLPEERASWTSFPEYEMRPDEYFVMGDNRRVSVDSRDFGPVLESQVLGKVFLRMGQHGMTSVNALERSLP